MIVCTRTADALSRQAFGKQNVAVSKIDAMMNSFVLDPAVSKPSKEAFIITSDDIRAPKVRDAFFDAAAGKHPDVRIVLVVKNPKLNIQKEKGINEVLIKPKAKELADTVYQLIEEIESKAPIVSSADSVPDAIDAFTPKEFTDDGSIDVNEIEKRVQKETEVKPEDVVREELKVEVTKEEEPVHEEEQYKHEMVNRIKSCNRVADVHVLAREITASKVVKEVIKENQQYVAIEEKLKAINNKIYAILADDSIRSLEEKIDKIQVILYDKDYYKVKNNTVIEQRVEELIDTLTTKTSELLHERLNDLDRAIANAHRVKGEEIDFPRLTGIFDQRANLIMELSVLNKEIHDIFYTADNLAFDTMSDMAKESKELTGNRSVDERINLRGEYVQSEETTKSIMRILETADRSSTEFKNAMRDIVVMQESLNKLLGLDRDAIAAQAEIINFLRSNNVEDSIVAETLLKKSLRVFVGEEGVGRTVVPYVLSKLKSRQNANVLHVDITGTAKFEDYGFDAVPLNEFAENRVEKEFCAVVGQVSDTPESMQRLLVMLTKAADYYRVINVVATPEQKELFNVIAPDVLSINYITDTNKRSLDFMAGFIKETKFDNVAQKVIINKCDVECGPIVKRLGIFDEMNIRVLKIPYIAQMVDCSLKGIKPYEIAAVTESFEEVGKYA